MTMPTRKLIDSADREPPGVDEGELQHQHGQRPRDAGDHGADAEGDDLVDREVHADDLRRDLVVSNRAIERRTPTLLRTEVANEQEDHDRRT